jgi:hypothetical protein
MYSQDVNEPILIDQKDTTRRVFYATINDSKKTSGETVSGTIVHQRKNKKDEWEDVKSVNLNSLKGGEGVKMVLKSSQLKKLYEGLTELYELSTEGVQYGEHEYVVGKSDEIITVSEKRKKYIEKLLEENYGEEIWNELVSNEPDLATKFSLARLQSNREKVLKEFEKSLKSGTKNEDYWQKFFEENSWIFGYGLNYKFLTLTSDQPNYGGADYTGKGKQKGDLLTKTESSKASFTVLVELKKANTNILAKRKRTSENVKYRNGAWLLSSELLGGISQIQINCKSWQKSAEELNNRKLIERGVFTIQPKGILLIGNTEEFEGDLDKITTFELFRQGLSNIEIITYDELFERAKYIVYNEENNEDKEITDIDEDLPF